MEIQSPDSHQSPARQDKLLAQADAKIGSGLVELSQEFPYAKKAKDSESVISRRSETATISISLHHTNAAKGKSVIGPMHERERYGLLVVVRPPPPRPTQFTTFPLYRNLGLVGEVGTGAGNAEFRAALKKLVDNALAAIELLNRNANRASLVERIQQ